MSIWLIYSTSVLQTSFTENATFMQYVVFSQEWEVGFVCLEGYKCVHKISDLWTLCYRETQAELIPQNTAVNTLPTGKHSLNRRPIYFESMSKFMHISFILNNIWNIFFLGLIETRTCFTVVASHTTCFVFCLRMSGLLPDSFMHCSLESSSDNSVLQLLKINLIQWVSREMLSNPPPLALFKGVTQPACFTFTLKHS